MAIKITSKDGAVRPPKRGRRPFGSPNAKPTIRSAAYKKFLKEHYDLHVQWALEEGDKEAAQRWRDRLKGVDKQ